MDAREEVALTGGRITQGVTRIGDSVRRPTGPHTPFVHSLLRHLEKVGFEGSPRVLGIDERGREIVTFVEGHVPPDLATRSDEQLVGATALIRRFHDASAGSRSPAPRRSSATTIFRLATPYSLRGCQRPSSTSTRPLPGLAAKTWATRCGCSWTLVPTVRIPARRDGASA